jgi:hypothetical protein
VNINWIEAFGYAGALLTLGTFAMTRMIPLRIIGIGANFAFIAYGALAPKCLQRDGEDGYAKRAVEPSCEVGQSVPLAGSSADGWLDASNSGAGVLCDTTSGTSAVVV